MVDNHTEPAAGVSVVIPCLNEEESIRDVVRTAREGLERAGVRGEVIVVDNGSTDRSVELALQAGARVLHEPERGYGAALRHGFDNARHAVLVMGDADMTYDLAALGDLVKPILDGQADLVVGNRFRRMKPGAMPALHRYVGNPVLSLMLRLMFHSHAVRDAHCGMRAISTEAYRRLGCVTTGMEFASEMIVRSIHNRLRMTERDIDYNPRVGESKLKSFRDGWRHVRFMLLHSPTSTLLLPGIVVWGLSLLIALPLAFGPVMVGGRAIDIHCMIMAGLLNIISVQLFTVGLLAKTFAHLSGVREDPLIAWLYRTFTLERFLLYTVPFILLGLFVTIRVIWIWAAKGFGDLDAARPLFLAMLCLVNGVMVAAGGYLFSIMALPRRAGPYAPDAGEGGDADAGKA